MNITANDMAAAITVVRETLKKAMAAGYTLEEYLELAEIPENEAQLVAQFRDLASNLEA